LLGLTPKCLMNRFSHRPFIHRLHQYQQLALQDFRNLIRDPSGVRTRQASEVLPPPESIGAALSLADNRLTDGGRATKEQTEAGKSSD